MFFAWSGVYQTSAKTNSNAVQSSPNMHILLRIASLCYTKIELSDRGKQGLHSRV
ncbi:hypothetical protein GCM10008022_41460 [Paenibacillus hunanensis]|nr:hypothetical protein GCM10008022_41460 [Paenibacillus hunanensis]